MRRPTGSDRRRAPRAIETLERRDLMAADVYITEFVADNADGLEDVDGERSDWIELFNAGDAATSLATLLQMTGHESFTAFDGPSALEAMERHRPDVVLLDIGLPGVSGYEVCRRARAQPWSNDITFIALTGWGQAEDRRRTQEAGFDSHLVKPVEFGSLIAQLDSLGAMRKA
jgi:CheY-like chemotaxis protein